MDINNIKIGWLSHRDTPGMCIMEAVSLFAKEQKSDHPRCVADILIKKCIYLNDRIFSTKKRTKLLAPLIPYVMGTAKRDPWSNKADPEHEEKIQLFMANQARERYYDLTQNYIGTLVDIVKEASIYAKKLLEAPKAESLMDKFQKEANFNEPVRTVNVKEEEKEPELV